MPHRRLARLLCQSEPWVQSWKRMNVRSRNPAAGTAIAVASVASGV
jgi:hypothetical protein